MIHHFGHSVGIVGSFIHDCRGHYWPHTFNSDGFDSNIQVSEWPTPWALVRYADDHSIIREFSSREEFFRFSFIHRGKHQLDLDELVRTWGFRHA